MLQKYYLPYETHQAKDGIKLTARDGEGDIIASGAGATLVEAQTDLKVFASAALLQSAKSGIGPYQILTFGQVPENGLEFNAKDLFPMLQCGRDRTKNLDQNLDQAERSTF